jgi:putative DNA primase/helicase
MLYQTVRYDPKSFKQRRPNGKGGWHWNLKGVRLVLYRLPGLLSRAADTVFI